jgi:transcriptional regulator with XRE-family HTH domain
MNYGKKIKEIRIMLKINQKEMAKELGISQSYLCAIESGTKRPNGNTILKLADRFHVNCSWLINETEPVFINKDDIAYIKSAEINDKSPAYNFPVLKNYLESTLGVSGEKLNFHRVVSDNMEPAIMRDDVVLVDTSEKSCDSEGIYLFKIDSRKVLGRIVFSPQKHIINDNPSIKNSSRILDSSMECIGKIIWFCRKI